MEGICMQEHSHGIRWTRVRAILGKCIAYLGFVLMGLLAIPALALAGMIYMVWCGANALARTIEKHD